MINRKKLHVTDKKGIIFLGQTVQERGGVKRERMNGNSRYGGT
jgi:hypothetical protein